jgi:molybdopterin-guanine dinucleotide biosynthesis protein A
MVEAMAGALIAGGASTRFGRDKASLPWEGGSLGGHLLAQMRLAGLAPLAFNAAAAIAGLPADVQILPDAVPGQGPLGGLATVLRWAPGPVLVAACDMPGLDAAAFAALRGAWRPGLRGLVARSADGWQPLFGIYAPELLPEIDRRLAAGQGALHRLIEDLVLQAWAPSRSSWLDNVNSVEEWEKWKSKSRNKMTDNQ